MKRLLSVLLCLMIIITITPSIVAATIEPTFVRYDIWIDDVQLANINAGTVVSSGLVSYDGGTKTLTLNGITINDLDDGAAIYWANGVVETIKLVGTNTITLTGDSACGIILGNNVTIKGDAGASLVINTTAGKNTAGIYTSYDSNGGTTRDEYSLTVKDVTLTFNDTSSYKGTANGLYAIDYSKGLTMNNVALNATGVAYGIAHTGSDTSAAALLTNVRFNITGSYGGVSFGDGADTMTGCSGSIVGTNDGIGFGGGTNKMERCTGTVSGYRAISTKGNLTMTNCETTLNATGTDSSTVALQASGSSILTVSGGKLTADSTSGCGIVATDTAKIVIDNNPEVKITAA